MHHQCRFLPLMLMLCSEIRKLPSKSWSVCEETAALVLFFCLFPFSWVNDVIRFPPKAENRLLNARGYSRSCSSLDAALIFPLNSAEKCRCVPPIWVKSHISCPCANADSDKRPTPTPKKKKRRGDLSCDLFSCLLPPGCLVLLQSCTLVFWVERWWTGAAWVRERNGLTRPRTRESRVRLDSAGQEKGSVNSLWMAEKWEVRLHTHYAPGSDIKTWGLCVWCQLSLGMTSLLVFPDCLHTI